MSRLTETAEQIYRAVLKQISAQSLVERAVRRLDNLCFIQDEPLNLDHFERIRIAGAGKAAPAMAAALQTILPDSDGLVVGQRGKDLGRIRSLTGSHPVPDQSSLEAGAAMLEFAASCGPGDLVLFCLSGGASALMEALVSPLELAELRGLTERLLASGAPITTVNAVRRQVSRIKGGRLAAAFNGAHVVVLVVSDVLTNDLSVVGSGPLFASSPATNDRMSATARAWTLAQAGNLPINVLEALLEPRIPPPPTRFRHVVLGSPALLTPLAAEAAREAGFEPAPYADFLTGEARQVARKLCRLAAKSESKRCLIFVGETTVTLRSKSGKGGRCQEMALAAALKLKGKAAFLAAGTDGADGPTDAAGAVVDHTTVTSRLQAIEALRTHDSYHYLDKTGTLIRTGPTDSNLTDLILVLIE